MLKEYSKKNVLDAALARLEIILAEFDNIYFSMSGGKDSSVMVQLANIVAKKLNKKFDILYIDLEAQYKATIDHVNELKKLSQINDFYHIALPISLRNAVSILQPKWTCWDENDKELWVREMPIDTINIDNNPFDFFKKGQEFEDFIIYFAQWYESKHKGKCACGVGIRADESLNRFRTIAMMEGKKETYKNYDWTTLIKDTNNLYNFYPLYDWKTQDIWGCVAKYDFPYNYIYELMYKNGLSIHQQRLCQPYGDDQRNGLDQFKALEHETWEKVVARVNGVNFGNIYARTTALGNIKSSKPDFMTWEQYAVFLLESIGIYNEELMLHYYEKINKFIIWHEKNSNITAETMPQEADLKLEQNKKAASWRRIARALEKNDFWMSRLSFGQTKKDLEQLEKLVTKWDYILSEETETDNKKLKEIKERIINEAFKSDTTR